MRPSQKHRTRRGHRPSETPYSARRLAFDVLTAWQQRGAFAGRVLDDLCHKHDIVGSDRALAMELSYGVIRRQATLDAVLAKYVDQPRTSVESGLWRLLQLGAWQVLLMDGIPHHAAVHETVEVARLLHRPAWTAVINGVLRTLCGSATESDDCSPALDRIPIDARRSRQLDREVFPSPEKARVEHLVKSQSFPRWLVRDWLDRFGAEETTRLCFWFNATPPLTLRVNRLRQTPEIVREVLQTADVANEPGEWPEALRLARSAKVHDLPGFAEGWFSVQDESSIAAARLLNPQPGESVLDLCAAPGGKTTHLAELMEDRGSILAVDTDADRLARVSENVSRLRLTCIKCRAVEPNGGDLPEGPFDRALVDVPCSNTGVLGKRPEARWRIDPEEIEELSKTQAQLLRQAIDHVKQTGVVVYSTCSIDPRENRQVVDRVLAERDDVTLEQEREHVPGRPRDGGYQALLRRR